MAGAYAYSSQGELMNMAVLGPSNDVTADVTLMRVFEYPTRSDERIASPVCSVATAFASVLSVSNVCRVTVDHTLTQGHSAAFVTVASGTFTVAQPFRVWYPTTVAVGRA